jgi:hypothetical protein
MIHACETVTVTAKGGQPILVIVGEPVGVIPAPPPGKVHRYKLYTAGERSS